MASLESHDASSTEAADVMPLQLSPAEVDELLEGLDEQSLPVAVEIADLPDLVRGYEQIKLDSIAVYHERLAELRDGWGRKPHHYEVSALDRPHGQNQR